MRTETLKYFNPYQAYRFSAKEDELWAGNFSASSWNNPDCGHLYNLCDFDKELVKDYKDPKCVIFRYETDKMFGHMKPLIKINLSNGRVYFLKDLYADKIEFATRGVKCRYINLMK